MENAVLTLLTFGIGVVAGMFWHSQIDKHTDNK